MPRRAAAVRRETQPDAKFNNRLVTQLINKVLLDGKKSIAENIVYGAFPAPPPVGWLGASAPPPEMRSPTSRQAREP